MARGQIKDGTIATQDLAPKTKQTLQRVAGYRQVRKTNQLGAFEPISTSFTVICGRTT